MKKSILLAFVAALALAVGPSSVAIAGAGEAAQASAKKGKGKGCKGKKGKGKAKGKSSALASAKGKAKGKGKGKGCKPKPKPKPKPVQMPVPPTPTPPTPAPPAPSNWPLSDGTYEDAGSNSVTLVITAGGTQAEAKFSGPTTCFPIAIGLGQGPVTSTATSMQAAGGHDGGTIRGKWSITVQSNLSYELVTDSATEFPETTPCNKTGVVFTGTLTKAG